MNYFKAGFISKAAALGYPEAAAEEIFKRANEYPGTSNMFKHVEDIDQSEQPVTDPRPLLEKLKHELLDADLAGQKK